MIRGVFIGCWVLWVKVVRLFMFCILIFWLYIWIRFSVVRVVKLWLIVLCVIFSRLVILCCFICRRKWFGDSLQFVMCWECWIRKWVRCILEVIVVMMFISLWLCVRVWLLQCCSIWLKVGSVWFRDGMLLQGSIWMVDVFRVEMVIGYDVMYSVLNFRILLWMVKVSICLQLFLLVWKILNVFVCMKKRVLMGVFLSIRYLFVWRC